jgi:hypothetical protein
MNRVIQLAVVGAATLAPMTVNVSAASATHVQEPPIIHELFLDIIDPTVCPQLQQIGSVTGGGFAGVLWIASDGDVYVANPLGIGGLNPVYDCPPYGNW